MVSIAAATPSQAGLEAVGDVVRGGGNAVDAAIAAVLVACVNEPGVCAPGAGAYVAVAGQVGDVVVFDGHVTIPGVGATDEPGLSSPLPADPSMGSLEVSMEYGGGVTTVIGPGSIATPGMWKALEAAHSRYGRAEWSSLVAPASRLASLGFPLGQASHTYLIHAHDVVFGIDPESWAVLHHADGRPLVQGEIVTLPALSATLDVIGRDGVGVLHGGELGRGMVDDLSRRGARLTFDDLASYRCEVRQPTELEIRGWRLSSNPGPAVGGLAMLGVLEGLIGGSGSVAEHVDAQHVVFMRRRTGETIRSASTVHVSTVDQDGLACSVTASAGYGSGVMPAGTGFWMNNSLGELELVPAGVVVRPGDRMLSNMAPTVGCGPGGARLAIGSPGADRIPSALAQVLWRLLQDNEEPEHAIAAPRLHVALGEEVVWFEPGFSTGYPPHDQGPAGLEMRRFPQRHMYFGGVGLAMRGRNGDLIAAADPRRAGAAGVVTA